MAQSPALNSIIYPESDGRPMADNTKQFNWIVYIKLGCESLLKDDPNVFVAGDLLWYPVEGDNSTSAAPDTMVAFGRPKGDRGSYQQWKEGNIPPQVVFEIMSPRNTTAEMAKKLKFYETHGVEEYYVYDPDLETLKGWLRSGTQLRPIEQMIGWVSPHLNTRFNLADGQLELYRPDGARFATYLELEAQVEQERQRVEQERQRAERLANKLRELGINPDEL